MTRETMQSVVCADCSWRSRRITGQIVVCPRCGAVASYDVQGGAEQNTATSASQKGV